MAVVVRGEDQRRAGIELGEVAQAVESVDSRPSGESRRESQGSSGDDAPDTAGQRSPRPVRVVLGAEFVGVTQVLVYIGAVIVLFLFGIMLTRAKVGHEDRLNHDNLYPAIMTAILLAAVMGYAVIDFARGSEIEVLDARPTTTEEVSDAIFSTYIVAFEAISVLLLAALIGAIVVARKE